MPRSAARARAFPNAYIEVDELPRRFPWGKALALAGAICTAYFGLTILTLSLFDTDYSPISQVASDYGVGRYSLEMNVGFFVGGVGLIAFALAYRLDLGTERSRAGPILLFVAGLVLLMESYVTTDLEGAPATLHGIIHAFGGLVFFVVAPVGTLLIYRRRGRGRLLSVLGGLVFGFLLLAANIGTGGLAERVILLVVFTSVILASVDLFRNEEPGPDRAGEPGDLGRVAKRGRRGPRPLPEPRRSPEGGGRALPCAPS
jgi:hypothetical membrane protein